MTRRSGCIVHLRRYDPQSGPKEVVLRGPGGTPNAGSLLLSIANSNYGTEKLQHLQYGLPSKKWQISLASPSAAQGDIIGILTWSI